MPTAVSAGKMERTRKYYELKADLEEFLFLEVQLLDDRKWMEWLDLLTEDLIYFMPMRRNVKYGEHEAMENTREGKDISWFDEGKWTLTKRVQQIMTGIHWAEEPLSRVCHLITNVQLLSAAPSVENAAQAVVSSNFLVYQNRVQSETYSFVGRRMDTLRNLDGSWKLARREIYLDQNVLQAKNLTVFF